MTNFKIIIKTFLLVLIQMLSSLRIISFIKFRFRQWIIREPHNQGAYITNTNNKVLLNLLLYKCVNSINS